MKSSTMCLVFILSGLLALATTPAGSARRQVDPAPPPVQAALQTPDRLQQLVAPIALYPDNLVGQVLAAATSCPCRTAGATRVAPC